MNRSYRIALICGATPLICGVSIFLLWLATRWDWLITAGLLAILGGVPIFLAGTVALARFCWLAFSKPELPRRRLWISAICCAGLLLSNFPVAAIIAVAGIMIETQYVVTVRSASEQNLYNVLVSGGGCEVDFGTILPGRAVRRSFWIQHDGSLEFHAVSGSITHNHTIDSYVTNGMGGNTTVTVGPDGAISFSQR